MALKETLKWWLKAALYVALGVLLIKLLAWFGFFTFLLDKAIDLWSGFWDADIWSQVGSPGLAFGFKIIVLGFVASVLLFWVWPKLAGSPEKKTTETDSDEKKPTYNAGAKWDYWFFYVVPQGWTSWLYSYLGDQGKYLFSRTADGGLAGFYLKLPWFHRVRLVDCRAKDIEIATEFLPAGQASSSQTTTDKIIGDAEERAKRIAEQTGSEITGKLSFPVTLTAGIAEGEIGARPLVQSDENLSVIGSEDVRNRFKKWVSDRIYTVVRTMPFLAAYHLNPMTLLIGDVDEAAGTHVNDQQGKPIVGFQRYKALLDMKDEDHTIQLDPVLDKEGDVVSIPDPINIFKIDLRNPKHVLLVIEKRPNSLLALFVKSGYWIYNVAMSDVNATKEIEDAQERRVVAVADRGTKNIGHIGDFVDKSVAMAGGSQVLAVQAQANDGLYVNNMIDLHKALRDAGHEVSIELIDARKYSLEQLRRLKQVAEATKNLTLLGSGGPVLDSLQVAAGVQIGNAMVNNTKGGSNS